MFYNRISELMPKKTLDKYIPPNLSINKKNEMAKILLDRRKSINKSTPQVVKSRASIFTTRFNKQYGGLKDKSIKNLSKYFKIQPSILNTIYDKGAGARLYKGILNIMKARKTGILPSSEAHDKSLVKKAMDFNNYIPNDIIS